MAAWLVAALVIVINGYLLVDFFSSEVNGVLFGSVLGVFISAYVAFIIYLVSRGVTFSSWCRQPKSVTEAENWVTNLHCQFQLQGV